VCFSALIILIIYLFNYLNNSSVIEAIFKIAGYTYGPLLGLFAFGLFSKYKVKDNWVPLLCFMAPLVTYCIEYFITNHTSYKIGFESLIINATLVILGLYTIVSKKNM
ncbi:MAG: sodium:solute symporter, partial [Bacteroidetes bacterium]|nr:sodium:solute symporter [Bacteroidota bacterium]